MLEKTPHILVIDDDWMNREVLEAYLLSEKYQVSTAHNAKKALELALAATPDLILLDAILPDMSGFEVCARLKTEDNTRFVPVVMITALESDEDKLKAIQAGADDFITKPFNYLLMLTRVRSLLKMKRLHDELQTRNALLHKILNRYVDEDIIQVILVDPERYLKLGGEMRRVTIVFADVSGFTAYAEQHSAQEVVQVLNKIFAVLTALVMKHHGTFDKYIGDAIMAFFGAPLASEHDTLNAVLMAWEMQVTFKALRESLGSDFPALNLKIGLHTGEAVVGNVGSEQVMSYTVIGDAVNTAHRLHEAAASGQILISEATYQEVKDRADVLKLEPRLLPGKREAIVLYEIIGLKA